MITGPEMHRKAVRVASTLESKIRAGTATDAERERVQTVRDHILVYEWAQDGRPAEETIPPPPRDPLTLQFVAWYERMRTRRPWRATDWITAAHYWWTLRGAVLDEDLLDEVAEELDDRGRRQERAA